MYFKSRSVEMYYFILLFLPFVGAGGLVQTEAYRSCSAENELPLFPLYRCPNDDSYTRFTVRTDIGPQTKSNALFLGIPQNATRGPADSIACPDQICTVIQNITIFTQLLAARAQWPLLPTGLHMPYKYILNVVNASNDTQHVPTQFCGANDLCDAPSSPDPCNCTDYGTVPATIDEVGYTCPFADNLCYELSCDSNAYRIQRLLPMCRVYQPAGPPLITTNISVTVSVSGVLLSFVVSGGLNERILGTYSNSGGLMLRAFMRKTAADPRLLGTPRHFSRGFVVVCDDENGTSFNSTHTLQDPPGCGTGPGERWFYVSPDRTALYGWGAGQYGQDAYSVLQDLSDAGCDASPNFTAILDRIPSPCDIIGDMDDSYLPPLYNAGGWNITGDTVSYDLDLSGITVSDAFEIDIDVPTFVLEYEGTVSPGYIDDSTSACYTAGSFENKPTIVPGQLRPVVCNPLTDDPPTNQTYQLSYNCDPAVVLERTTDTVTVPNGACDVLVVDYNISESSINDANRICNVFLVPSGDGTRTDPYPISCQFGYALPGSDDDCSVWGFKCNFEGKSNGAWYRCVPFWIILAAALAGIAVLIWVAVTRSQKEKYKKWKKAETTRAESRLMN